MTIFSKFVSLSLKLLKGAAITFSSIIGIAAIFLYFFQDKLLYINYGFANPMLNTTPAHHGCKYEDVWISTEDGEKLHAWLLYHDQDPSSDGSEHTEKIAKLTKKAHNAVMIYYHGNAADISSRIRNLVELYRDVKALDAILIVDYRGFGKSTGTPTEKGLVLDARATLSYAKYELGADKVVVFGRSLGGAVGISLMENDETAKLVDLLILENTFSSVPQMIPHVFPKWLFFLPFFCWNKWESFRVIDRVKCPVLFISGLKDEIVPSFMMQKLYDACKSPDKHLETYDNGKHNETFMEEEYYKRFAAWVEKHLHLWRQDKL